jgi:uncharacterized membrane-anchored protein
MISKLSRNQIGLLFAAAAQLGILAYIVTDRIWLLKQGREIVLPIIPVDPRDLFRGDYVTLSFPASRVPASIVETSKSTPGKHFFVTLDQAVDGTWTPSRVTVKHPGTPAANQIVLKGRERYALMSDMFVGNRIRNTLDILYGFERYYVSEGRGGRLEALSLQKKLAVVLAVDARGNAAIKGINVDGKRYVDEPVL